MPMLTMFDKQLQLRMGQANIKRWVDDIMPLWRSRAEAALVPQRGQGLAHRLVLDAGLLEALAHEADEFGKLRGLHGDYLREC